MGTPATVINHGTHRRPHSRDTEGSMKGTFGQLADLRPPSICAYPKVDIRRHLSVGVLAQRKRRHLNPRRRERRREICHPENCHQLFHLLHPYYTISRGTSAALHGDAASSGCDSKPLNRLRAIRLVSRPAPNCSPEPQFAGTPPT